jgi:hypothetical protein
MDFWGLWAIVLSEEALEGRSLCLKLQSQPNLDYFKIYRGRTSSSRSCKFGKVGE